MSINKFVLCALLLLPMPTYAEVCEVQKAADRQLVEASKVSRNIAERTIQDISKLQALMESRKWQDNVPMIEQMNAQEATEFEELRRSTINRQLASLIPSKRERDIVAIGDMAKIAKTIANETFEFPADTNSEEAKLAAILIAARQHLPLAAHKTYPNADKASDCNLENSLRIAADAVAQEATDYPFLPSAADELDRLSKQYPNLSEADMTERDRKALAEARRIVVAAATHMEMANDFLRLALMEKASNLLYEASTHDLFQNPGDLDAVGATWQAWVAEGHVSPELVKAAQVLFYLNDEIPAQVIKDYEEAFSETSRDRGGDDSSTQRN